MRAREFLKEDAKVGREHQHLEDFLIVDGAQGGLDALDDLQQVISDTSNSSVKWDGMAAVFWGRDDQGNFMLLPQNQWAKKQQLNKVQLSQEIMSTGRKRDTQSDEQFVAARKSLAQHYEKLWDVFEAATPANFRGFVKGDLMFASPQTPNANGEYEFIPNKVTYHVSKQGLFGKMPTAEAFVTVHGKAEQGTPGLTPLDDKTVQQFNQTPQLIALNITRPRVKILPVDKEIQQGKQFIAANKQAIDTISNFSAPKFSSFKQVLYTYSVARGKHHDLPFDAWLQGSKVSANQQSIIAGMLETHAHEWQLFWKAFDMIGKIKHHVISQLNTAHEDDMFANLGIRSSTNGQTGGEGYMSGIGKLINPAFRSAPPNPRFTGDIG